MYIDNTGRLDSKFYDKLDDYDFPIVTFPFLTGNVPTSPDYGVYISQQFRYCRTCDMYNMTFCVEHDIVKYTLQSRVRSTFLNIILTEVLWLSSQFDRYEVAFSQIRQD